ncbi:MAG: transglutaminase family protein [Acidimicrobiales bacterium]
MTALGLSRLFRGNSFVLPVLGTVAVGHGLGYVGRRWHGRPIVSLSGAGAGVTLLAIWVNFGRSTTWGLPGGRTLHAVSSALAHSVRDFHQLAAPVPATPGFLFVAMLAVGAIALWADWSGLHHQAEAAALVGPFALFVFTSALGTPNRRTLWTALWLGAALVYLATSRPRPVADAKISPSRALGRLGGRMTTTRSATIGLALIAVVAGLVIGPNLPGAEAVGLIKTRASAPSGSGSRTTISPLVDIRNRLVLESNTQLFTVSSTAPAYWRLTSLGNFDGNIWSSIQSYQHISGRLPALAPHGAATLNLAASFKISNLDSAWLPAAWQPVQVNTANAPRYNEVTGSLVASGPTSNGITYQVISEVPQYTPAELSRARVDDTDPQAIANLGLPRGIPAQIINLTNAIVAGRDTPYSRALALQDYFRHNFEYDLSVPPGHSDSAMVRFLDARKGYCEQFAGTFAVMARLAGLPARVAVGFTPGLLGSDGRYHVTGGDAHSWPEVLLGAFGWVSFEPTPGRGQPGTQAYTGVAPAQTGANGGGTGASTSPAGSGPAPMVTAPASRPQAQSPGSAVKRAHHLGATGLAGPGLVAAMVALALVGVGAVIWIAGGVALCAWEKRRRYKSGPTGRVLGAWADATSWLELVGLTRGRAETVHDFTRRVSATQVLGPCRLASGPTRPSSGSGAADALINLSGTIQATCYAAQPAAPDWANSAELSVAIIRKAITDQVHWRDRLRHTWMRPIRIRRRLRCAQR